MKKLKNVVLIGSLAMFSMSSFAATVPDSIDQSKGDPNPASEAKATSEAKTESPLTGTFDLTTNYMFRGISQSNNLPAAQGGLTYSFPIGIYMNVWGSSVNFPDSQGNTATTEIDTTLGFAKEVCDHFSYDISMQRYNYPKTSASYNEAIAKAQYYFLTGTIGYSSNVYNLHASGTYYNLGFTWDVPSKVVFNQEDVNISGGVGRYYLPGGSAGLKSYNDYNLQISKQIGIYNVALQWTDTNGQSVDAPPLRNAHLLGTVTASF